MTSYLWRKGPVSEERQGFFNKSPVVRWLIGIAFTAAFILFLHFRETRVEVLEPHSIADRSIVSQLDYSYTDEELTQAKRLEAESLIGTVYRLNPVEVAEAQGSLERWLAVDDQWEKAVPEISLEALYDGIEQFASSLIAARFSDIQTLNAIAKAGLNRDKNFSFPAQETDGGIALPGSFWNREEDLAFEGTALPRVARKWIVHYFEGRSWSLEVDEAKTTELKRSAALAVPEAVTQVPAGSVVINKGETATAKQLVSLRAMNGALAAGKRLLSPATWIGSAILALLFVSISVAYLRLHEPSIFFSNRRLSLLVVVLAISLGLSKAVEYVLLKSHSHLIDYVGFPLLVPFAAILLCSLLNSRVALYFSGFLSVVMSMSLVVNKMEFLIANLVTALVAIFTTRSFRRRKEVFIVCGWAWLAALLVSISFQLLYNPILSTAPFIDALSTFTCLLLTGVLVVGLLPLLESLFQVLTEVSLMEYMDPTHPLLRRLSLEAPGTYQHSIVVGNLAEAAALSIGANGLFCRVAALYHDIGKVISPATFAENQQGESLDVHKLLTPVESAHALIAHVAEGCAIARRQGIPEAIIDVIKQHHGTTLVYYFYHMASEQAKRDGTECQEREFRYLGPKPRRKETAIIMIADTAEAASRTLDELNEHSVGELVDRLIREKTEDGQFEECELTLKELTTVRNVLVHSLVVAGHSRVKYPARRPVELADEVVETSHIPAEAT